MAIYNDYFLEYLLYDTFAGQRYLQDSPVMPGLWIEFARNPYRKLEILITPHRNVRSGDAAKWLRRAIAGNVDTISKTNKGLGISSKLELAPLANQVGMQLTFSELMTSVIPLTTWWWSIMRNTTQHELNYESLLTLLEAALAGNDEQPVLPPSLIWLARLAGSIHFSSKKDMPDRDQFLFPHVPRTDHGFRMYIGENAQPITKAFLELMPESTFDIISKSQSDDLNLKQLGCIFRVSHNRPVKLAIKESVAAIKADAVRRLFDISCKNITWAIIDSGIDIHHDAFMDHTGKGSRVDAVYDFTILRELNNLDEVESALNNPDNNSLLQELVRRQRDPENNETAIRTLSIHRQRLVEGRDIDYDLIEPFLRDFNPARPSLAHGTTVAGILGADWRKGNRIILTGVCPDIRLIDMRVTRQDGKSSEFEVIAALEFLRHYNEKHDRLAIHGANLSLSIVNDLQGGDACGRTPVCIECERNVNMGVCIVVAAGNFGSVHWPQYSIFDERLRMHFYQNSSITDPGNTDAVITVGATHRNRPHEYGVSYFSSRGPTGDGRMKPDLVAPGERISAPAPDQKISQSDGTSLAAPHVSGSAALIMARNAEFIGQPRMIKTILCETATDLKREKYFQGAGLVDVLRALQSI